MTDFEPILGQGYGYGFAVGLGAAFALLMAFITKILSRFMGQVQNSERFSTASRNVSSGLIASSTVSAWTWPATLLSSGGWSYSHGISGGFLYGVGGTIQVTLFLFLALQIKQKAPTAHTVSECFSIRFGTAGHWVYLSYCICTNVLISSLLLLGGSQGFSAATGMHVVAASFLLPLGVMAYTALGGLKATFISDWIHTVIIYIILIVTSYTVYCSSSLIGSPSKMYDLLQQVQKVFPSESGQSYLSFHDSEMFFLTWSVMLGGLSSVFGDPGYSQRAIASDAKSVFQGYLMGGLCWWVIPMCLGSSAGLACRALLLNPSFVTYPNPLSASEVDSGMPVIYGMYMIFGKSGAAAGLLMLFMSVTSASSAELIAFSSVATYDIYRIYVKPNASGKELVRISHLSVFCFSMLMAILSVVFNYIGVTVGWLLSFIGIILSPEVFSVTMMLFWPKMTKLSLLIGAPLGTLTGIACWVGSTYVYGTDHLVNKNTLMTSKATFIGNITALFSAPIYIFIISMIKPDPKPFDLSLLGADIKMADDYDVEEEKAIIVTDKDEKVLKRQTFYSLIINFFILLLVYVMVACILFGIKKDFSKSSFVAFIIVCLIWVVVAALYIILLPLYQGRHSLLFVIKHLIKFKLPEHPLNYVEEEQQQQQHHHHHHHHNIRGSDSSVEEVEYVHEEKS
ncbi:putative urea active transporter 2 [Pichia californica]|uniref:Urea active transporter 2 n=1 Tax=Pichia californica TaxID=460514 RepID=A0A9P7BFV5_9ASCO|nr:putative urea active transporter 2 [[Candida] californica]KAG0688039.1 putative urea active transporter 2 [[Candida] californica]